MTTGPWRLERGGSVDRTAPLEFTFDGRPMTGYAGDTVASALLANGHRVVARSFKFHRPRGVFSAGYEEPNALLRLGAGASVVPSARATAEPLVAGCDVRSQSGWPSVDFDALSLFDLAPRLLAAGFYNKTFIWPGWHAWEGVIRRLAGLGTAPTQADTDRYEHRHLHCDVLVIGGGLSGLHAAIGAARQGLDVVLAEARDRFGGRRVADARVPAMLEVARAAGVTLLPSTVAVAAYGADVVTLVERHDAAAGAPRERLWIARPARVVLATGAIEQPLVFANNDRPGVMLASAAHEYLARFAIAPGHAVLVATNNDSAYATAIALVEAGVRVVGVADTRTTVPPHCAHAIAERGIPSMPGTMPLDTAGRSALRAVTLGSSAPEAAGAKRVVDADALLVAGGCSPALSLFTQMGGKLRFDPWHRALVPVDGVQGIALVGRCAGFEPCDATLRHAERTGADDPAAVDESPPRVDASIGPRIAPSGNRWRQFVDLRHDVTVGDLELAVAENYRSIEHVKRYTTVGMSVDQGKTSNAAAIEIVAAATAQDAATLGHTTMRPPVTPVTLGTLAGPLRGPLYAPHRITPLHEWNAARRAVFHDYGEWRRVACYPRPGESEAAAIAREVRLVRSGVALFDASPLGKIEVHGPDARVFLDRFYVNRIDTLKPNVARYALMLRESGGIFDDGTVTALDDSRFLLTTTSGNAGRVAAWLDEWHQCEWPELRVAIVPVTEQWATLAVAGPRARDVLAPLFPDGFLSPERFAHFGVRETAFLGRAARMYRVSFSGELCYELNVPAGIAADAADVLMEAGRAHGMGVYGTEAVLRLRVEKGYLHVGVDTDASTVPADIGWGRIVDAKPGDFIGRRSLSLPENRRPDRRQLVGLRSTSALPVGAHVRREGVTTGTDGWITSAATDSADGTAIALALVAGGESLVGRSLSIHDAGRVVAHARVVKPVFYDPSHSRMVS